MSLQIQTVSFSWLDGFIQGIQIAVLIKFCIFIRLGNRDVVVKLLIKGNQPEGGRQDPVRPLVCIRVEATVQLIQRHRLRIDDGRLHLIHKYLLAVCELQLFG